MKEKWGIYPWFIEHGEELIHPNDLKGFLQETSSCKLYQCIGVGEYLTLKYQNKNYRVKKELET